MRISDWSSDVCSSDLFGDVPDEYHRLIPISVEERAGLIWGVLTPGLDLELDQHLGGILPMLEKLGLDKFHFAGEADIKGANWKPAHDGHIEHYNFGVLHKETFCPFQTGRAACRERGGRYV